MTITLRRPDRIACPDCRSIDWFRDGCLVTGDDADGIEIKRVVRSDSTLRGSGWSCNTCGYELGFVDRLRRNLDAIERLSCDPG